MMIVIFTDGRVDEINADRIRVEGGFFNFYREIEITLQREIDVTGPWPWSRPTKFVRNETRKEKEWVCSIRSSLIDRFFPAQAGEAGTAETTGSARRASGPVSRKGDAPK